MKKSLLFLAAGVAVGYYLRSMKKCPACGSASADELPKGANPSGLGDPTPDMGGGSDVSRLRVGPSEGLVVDPPRGMVMADPLFSGSIY